MSKPIFTWPPDQGSQQNCKPNVHVAKFGDGYESRVASGLNNQPMTWSLTFDRASDESGAILAFIRARGGVESFTWTTPLNETGTYVCREWDSQRRVGGLMVTCKFDQVFEF